MKNEPTWYHCNQEMVVVVGNYANTFACLDVQDEVILRLHEEGNLWLSSTPIIEQSVNVNEDGAKLDYVIDEVGDGVHRQRLTRYCQLFDATDKHQQEMELKIEFDVLTYGQSYIFAASDVLYRVKE